MLFFFRVFFAKKEKEEEEKKEKEKGCMCDTSSLPRIDF